MQALSAPDPSASLFYNINCIKHEGSVIWQRGNRTKTRKPGFMPNSVTDSLLDPGQLSCLLWTSFPPVHGKKGSVCGKWLFQWLVEKLRTQFPKLSNLKDLQNIKIWKKDGDKNRWICLHLCLLDQLCLQTLLAMAVHHAVGTALNTTRLKPQLKLCREVAILSMEWGLTGIFPALLFANSKHTGCRPTTHL